MIATMGWVASITAHTLAPVLAIAALQFLGGIFAARHGWDALGSFATNCLVFSILLALLPWWPVALAITLLDLRRRAWVFRVQ